MDGHGFDLLTKRLALLITRRAGLRALLAGAGAAGVLGLPAEPASAACGGPGVRCRRGRQCCSGICLRGRKKKGKSGKRKGRCDCSFPLEGCNVDGDCCLETSTCGDNGCDPDNRCCEGEGAECFDPCDCCFNFTCEFEGDEEVGQCVPCGLLQEPCSPGDFCCANGSFCDTNGSGDQTVCCLDVDFECVDDLDCCGALRCSSRLDNTCQTCAALGEWCGTLTGPPPATLDGNCCDRNAECFSNACGASNVCCLPEGADCEEDCDCCQPHACDQQTKTCQFDLGGQSLGAESRRATNGTTANTAARGEPSATRRRSGKVSHERRRRR
jgi:hypothetical protein